MPPFTRTLGVRALIAIVLLVWSAAAATKGAPDLSGVWRLDRDLTTAHYVKDDILVVRQSRQKVKFVYRTRDDQVTGTDVFVTDGKESSRYTTRIERAYYRARWSGSTLLIVTRHVLDPLGYQTYNETDSWALDDDGKTLVERLSDGKVAVYHWQGPAPKDTWENKQELHAVGVYSEPPEPSPNAKCQFDLNGTMKANPVGEGSYRLCITGDEGTTLAVSRGCTPLRGTMTFSKDDGLSSFVLEVSGQYCAEDRNFLGSYEVDPNRITGEFNNRLTGGSGTIQFSESTSTLVLYGVVLYE